MPLPATTSLSGYTCFLWGKVYRPLPALLDIVPRSIPHPPVSSSWKGAVDIRLFMDLAVLRGFNIGICMYLYSRAATATCRLQSFVVQIILIPGSSKSSHLSLNHVCLLHAPWPPTSKLWDICPCWGLPPKNNMSILVAGIVHTNIDVGGSRKFDCQTWTCGPSPRAQSRGVLLRLWLLDVAFLNLIVLGPLLPLHPLYCHHYCHHFPSSS